MVHKKNRSQIAEASERRRREATDTPRRSANRCTAIFSQLAWKAQRLSLIPGQWGDAAAATSQGYEPGRFAWQMSVGDLCRPLQVQLHTLGPIGYNRPPYPVDYPPRIHSKAAGRHLSIRLPLAPAQLAAEYRCLFMMSTSFAEPTLPTKPPRWIGMQVFAHESELWLPWTLNRCFPTKTRAPTGKGN